MLLATFVWITVCAIALLGYYIWTVPEGPECPRCGQPGRPIRQGEASPGTPMPLRDYMVAARCPACGWEGRFRNRAAASLALQENPSYGRAP